MKAPIQSKKHYVQNSTGNIGAGAVENIDVVLAIEGGMTNPNHVREGSAVKAIYFEYWLINGASTSQSGFVFAVYKSPGNGFAASAANMAALHDWTNKKNILFTSQGLWPKSDQNPVNVIRQWVKIPKGKQRMGLNDTIKVAIFNAGVDDLARCGFATYKSYS